MADSDPTLPPPATASDIFAQASYDVLRQIRDRLDQLIQGKPTAAKPAQSGSVELREPDASGVPADKDEPAEKLPQPARKATARTRRKAADTK